MLQIGVQILREASVDPFGLFDRVPHQLVLSILEWQVLEGVAKGIANQSIRM